MIYLTVRKYFRADWNAAGKDVVVLHQFWRGKYCPNMSPYVLKVECFMRLAGIKYVVSKIYVADMLPLYCL